MIIDKLENCNQYNSLHHRFPQAFEYLIHTDFSTIQNGKHEIDGKSIFAMVNSYETSSSKGLFLEAHKNYIDIQYIFSGSEKIGVTQFSNQSPIKRYTAKDDYHLFNEKCDFITFNKGMIGIFHPQDLHMPGIIKDFSEQVKKIVIKVLL